MEYFRVFPDKPLPRISGSCALDLGTVVWKLLLFSVLSPEVREVCGAVPGHSQQRGVYSGTKSSWVTITFYFCTLIFEPVSSQD